ncbi:MBL fold metallo-hydrolase [Salinigranum rubrum]|uniref:MBL fold metallo-hydrolase n=1 Tax=Salinigranum rubrum TaxID=755307 RepID=A0A2I8VK60_9EURY|nr:MBL fold metallo-hydrolase [Salinigranum rubrum]AUV82308.1 MBL fold metallo-hydrolase [Salinigranum rubrum]
MAQQFPDLGHEVPEISAETLKERLDAGEEWTLLDTRRPADFAAWQLSHPNIEAVNVPFTAFLNGDDPADGVPEGVPPKDADRPLVTCCAKGISSLYVAEFLTRAGWDVYGLADGMEGWARLYESRAVDSSADATVIQYHRPSSGCLAYLVVSGGEALVVDPLRAFADRYVADVRELGAAVVGVADTHVHADHVSGLREVADATGAERFLPAGAAERGLAFDATLLSDGDELRVGDATVAVVALPGHTTEMTGYLVDDVLLAGDSVFVDSVARPDLEDADVEAVERAARALYGTVRTIGSMPDDRVVASNHAGPETSRSEDGTYTARVGDLRESLAAFSLDEDEFVARVTDDLPPQPNEYQRIIAANLGRERVNDDEAFELELGPNNCAAG